MKHGLVRDIIIETASDLFYQKGYNLTGINEIISTANIAKATLYSHFKSKDEICIAFLKYKNEEFLDSIEKYVQTQKKGKDQVLAIFDFLLEFYKSKTFNGCWCINTVSEIPRDKKQIRDEIQSQKKGFIDFIQRTVDKAFPRRNDATRKLLSKKIYLIYEGAVAESHLHQKPWPITTARSLCKDII